MVNLNFSDVKDREPLPEGTYAFTIAKAEEKNSSAGNPMIVVQFKEDSTGTIVFNNYPIMESTLWKLKELCAAIGFDVSGECAFDPSEMEGAIVKAKVTQEEYQGRIQNRISKVYAC